MTEAPVELDRERLIDQTLKHFRWKGHNMPRWVAGLKIDALRLSRQSAMEAGE